MRQIELIKFGKSEKAFRLTEKETPALSKDEVLIKSEGFGLNFADVMARLGLYPACPPLPAVLGYENVGRIAEVGTDVEGFKNGDRVLAFTRFGGYSDYIKSKPMAIAKIPESFSTGEAVALATQYITAWYAVEECVRLHRGDHVLVHAAAGGVGTALIQLLKHKECVIFGTVGNNEKVGHVRELGVDYPINYRESDYSTKIKELGFHKKIHVSINPVGGDYVKKDLELLNAGGRLIVFGASKFTNAKNLFQKLGVLWSFGKYSPIKLMSESKSIIGLNMLAIADESPEAFSRGLRSVIKLAESGVIKPVVGKTFNHTQIADAHRYLESRQSIGKLVINWD